MIIVYNQLRLLVNLVICKLDLNNFLKENFASNGDLEKLRLDELPEKDRAHEKCHSDAWAEDGVSSFYCIIEDNSATVPYIDSLYKFIEAKKINKEQFIKSFLYVVTAPERAELPLGKTDNWMKRILRKEFKTLSDFAQAYASNL